MGRVLKFKGEGGRHGVVSAIAEEGYARRMPRKEREVECFLCFDPCGPEGPCSPGGKAPRCFLNRHAF